ncbi:MAG: hypothetical protein ACQEVA_14090 [Myxococcota bacterium]
MSSEPSQNVPQELRERVAALPGVDVETDGEHGRTRLVFTIPDLATALRLEWPTVLVLGGPALAIVISAIVELITNGTEAAAQITILIFVAPVLLIMAAAVIYRRRKSRRVIELAEDLIVPGPWMLAHGGEHEYKRADIIRLEKVARRDTLTRLTHGHIVVESAFQRATFAGHLKDEELAVLWDFVRAVTGMEAIKIPLQRMVTFSVVVGLAVAAATFFGVDAVLREGPRPQIVHAFAGLTVGAVMFVLLLGAWRRTRPTLEERDRPR